MVYLGHAVVVSECTSDKSLWLFILEQVDTTRRIGCHGLRVRHLRQSNDRDVQDGPRPGCSSPPDSSKYHWGTQHWSHGLHCEREAIQLFPQRRFVPVPLH